MSWYTVFMRTKGLIILFILLAGIVIKTIPTLRDSSPVAVNSGTFYPVTYVIDGDTVKIAIDGQEETLRLLGINTPEIDGGYRKGECFGPEASKETKQLLEGKNVRIETDSNQSKRDKYNRLLVYVFLEDGININEELIKRGFAREYTYAGFYTYQKEFKVEQAKARADGRGLWNKDNCLI